ncbi:hypothetical protein ROLI_040450 [Roseobacter fucihabitans]|uniref:Cupin type-2 domain-containing protein n=1 Tax=Roseobacter fucihabitans TaxID=1537242 RepID=A0ABZ2BY56_9RHOB|nr:cupin domain-containing protein [Roseobacter litoralis]MBC6965175.1 hypothetical protein [Roseobacter litoralis]MBC6965822.1 hypothetical protein [Roseobacter litoralis]
MTSASQTVLNRQSAPHYTWGEVCEGWRLMGTLGLSVIEERMPPNAEEVRHFHQEAHQLFYVIEGELSMEVEGEMHRLTPNDALPVLPQQAHQARNDSQSDVRFLVISAPGADGDRVPT